MSAAPQHKDMELGSNSENSGDSGNSVKAEATSSTFGAAFNVICCVVGAGLLQLPFAVAQSGWIGVLMLCVLSVMAWYSGDILIKCLHIARGELGDEQVKCKSKLETYGDIGEAAFGTCGRIFVNVQMHLTLVLVAVVYNLLAGLNFLTIFSSFNWVTPDVAMVIVAVMAWFHVFLKTMGEVAILSSFNFVITVALLVVVICEACTNPPSTPVHHSLVVPSAMKLGGAFASFAFGFGVHPILPDVYKSMRKPQQYRTMLSCAFVGVMLFYLPMVIVCYTIYGDDVKSPVYETGGLSAGLIVKIIIALLTVHIIGGYAIVINPPEVALEAALGVKTNAFRIVLRSFFVLFTCLVSVLMKTNFPPFLELVSSFTSVFTQYILPCLFYIRLSSRAGVRLSRAELWWNYLIIGVAIIGAVFGTIEAIKDIVSTFFVL
eukprot:TRINITY_DN65307_c0_g1_i1.p1 TRINITY_DN65307_c0_g1~~TRINITY_DN65307_c0_g1_i1.p1  ORF type:complete len:433 (+),score=55.44 TRINITY_DN65307_c0_g1_i1:76-1374(+)